MQRRKFGREFKVEASNVLDRQFTAERPNQKWIADFTYISVCGR